ncbi:OsmC family peroxiredoxin [bacterium]|nr:MAG: OsmC family peroxiredoxin [bacterium]
MQSPNHHIKNIVAFSSLTLGLLAIHSQPLLAQATHTTQDWAQATTGYKNDSLRDYLARLKSALLLANKQPEQAQPLKFSASVVAEGRTGIRHLRIRNFQFLSDGTPDVGEYNLGAGSWPSVVGVLGSAVAQDFLTQAAIKGIPLDELEVVFTSRPGAAPSATGGRGVTYPRALTYTAYIVSPASDAQLEDLRRTVERVSPVLNLVSQSQNIEHGQLIYTQTPKDRGNALPGLRDFLDGKRAAAKLPPTRPTTPTRRGGGEPPLRAHIKVEGATGIRHIRTDTSNFQMIHDNPRYLAGHNLGPVAEEHILGVMITCLTHIFEIQATNRGVDLDSLELEVEGTLTRRIGSIETPPKFENIRYRVHIGSPESKETIEQLQQAVESSCPIYNMLKDSQEIKGNIVRGPYREPLTIEAAF